MLGCRGEAAVSALAAALRAGLEAGEATWHGALNRRIAEGGSVMFGRIDPESWMEVDDAEDLSRLEARLGFSAAYG